MHERRFNGGIEKLRSPERVAMMEIEKVVGICTEGENIRSVLDIGTGTGLFAEAFSKLGLEVTGIDVSKEMLVAAGNYVPAGRFENAPAEDIPFPDNSFDLTFFGLILHEADDLVKALKEAKRVTGKRVAVLEWPYKNGEQGPPLEHRIKPEFFEKIIKDAGFNKYDKIMLQNLELILLNP